MFGARGLLGRPELGDRSGHDERPVGTGLRRGGEQAEIDALVDHAGEAEAGGGDRRLVRRLRRPARARGKRPWSTLDGKACTLSCSGSFASWIA